MHIPVKLSFSFDLKLIPFVLFIISITAHKVCGQPFIFI